MGIHSYLVPCRFLTMLGHFLAAVLVFFSYVRRHTARAHQAYISPRPPSPLQQRDNIVVALRFDYTDAEYGTANSRCDRAPHYAQTPRLF